MAIGFRFGRRLRVPSTHEIKVELQAAMALEAGRIRHALANNLPETAGWDEIGQHLADAERAKALKV